MEERTMRHVLKLFAALVLLMYLAQGQAQDKEASGYPTKPIRIIQPAPPGGASDVILRSVAQRVSTALGQTMVVDNRPGAHGVIANELAARAKADGYTLLYGTVGTIAINTSLYTKTAYRMPDDFAPITQFVDQANLVLVNVSLPVESLEDLMRVAKSKSGGLTFGSAGSGSATHLGAEMFRIRAGIYLKHIPYKGAAAAAAALAGGEVNVLFVSPVTALPFIRSGRIRAVAVSTAHRIPQLPDVPTIAESGYPGFAYGAWSGMLARAGTPPAIVDLLHAQFVGVLRSEELRKIVSQDGATAAWSESPAAFGSFIRAQIAAWGTVIRKTGARVE
jgi:tripartite-type tricarboxylate transporter receptor subunit TctC